MWPREQSHRLSRHNIVSFCILMLYSLLVNQYFPFLGLDSKLSGLPLSLYIHGFTCTYDLQGKISTISTLELLCLKGKTRRFHLIFTRN